MKFFKLMAIALLAILGLNSCSNDSTPPLDFIEVNYNKEIVGTWTCLKEDFAEALIFKADGTFESIGVANGEYWEHPNATWSLKNNKLALSSGDYKSNVLLEIIPGNSLALVDEKGNRNVFQYCENDLADEIVGMWVCTEEVFGQAEEAVAINTFDKNGKSSLTAFLSDANGYINQDISDYKVVGDLLIGWKKNSSDTNTSYLVLGLYFIPNGTELGDIMTFYNPVYGTNPVFLRIKQSLDLAEKEYDYSNVYVTNVKADDVEFDFAGQKLNFAALDGSMMDKMMRNILFNVSFPTADKFVYTCYVNDNKTSIEAPIVVDGNKITIKMSENKAVYRDIDVYTFQDVDACQMHMYMPRSSFVKFIANIGVVSMSKNGEIDLDDTEAVKAVYDNIDKAIETINVSFIFKSDK